MTVKIIAVTRSSLLLKCLGEATLLTNVCLARQRPAAGVRGRAGRNGAGASGTFRWGRRETAWIVSGRILTWGRLGFVLAGFGVAAASGKGYFHERSCLVRARRVPGSWLHPAAAASLPPNFCAGRGGEMSPPARRAGSLWVGTGVCAL